MEAALAEYRGRYRFLLDALALTFAFHQARIIENAGGIGGERVQDLAVEF